VVAFLNIGKFFGRHEGTSGAAESEFFTFPQDFIRKHHEATSSWEKVHLRGLETEIAQFKGEAGFESIARVLGVDRPRRIRDCGE